MPYPATPDRCACLFEKLLPRGCMSTIVLFLALETAVTNAVTTASGITTNGPQFSRMVEMVQELVS